MQDVKKKKVDNFPPPSKKVREAQVRVRNKKIKSMYRQGYSMREIAKYLFIGKSTVHTVVHS